MKYSIDDTSEFLSYPDFFGVGKEITGVIYGIFLGGYLLTIRLENGVTLRVSMLTSDQP